VSSDTEPSARFEPLQPASRWLLIAGIVLGPLLWLVALVVSAWLIAHSWAIEVGLLVAFASFLVSLAVLAAVYAGRRRQEKRYVDGG
jgi:hypothetical protein